jgi:hypothetical protein
MTEQERAVADAVLHCHDAMEGGEAEEVPTDRIMTYLSQEHGFAASEDRSFVGEVLRRYHGDLWIIGEQSAGPLPTYVLLIEEMAGKIEWDVLGNR